MTTAAKFEVRYLQYLDPEGKPAGKDMPGFAGDKEEMLGMYRMMTLARVFDRKAIALQRTGQLGTYASCLGHEATHVGIGAVMREEDAFFPMYREYATQFMRGVKMEEVLLFWGGDERGSDFSGPAQDFPWCVPIATQCHHATGAAMAFKYRKEARVAVSVIGDGGTSQGDFYESLNAAGTWKLPAVFVVANNQWAISVPLSIQTACETLAQKAVAGGFEGIQVDGNDVIAVRAAMDEAMEKARNGEGPTLIEAVTYRLSDHTTADDARRYRSEDEVKDAEAKEPLVRLRKYIMAKKWWTKKQEDALLEECGKQVDEAVQVYLDTGKPPVESMFDHMFAELPDSLREQRDIATREAEDHG